MDKVDVERGAVALAIRYLEHQGYEVDDVSRTRGHNGYDLLARRAEDEIKVEVKGCTREWGIPDPYETEFDEERRLVADFLYVVYFLDGARPQLCVIPRNAIDPELVKPKSGYRISGRFKKESVLSKFMVSFDDTES